MSKKWLKAKKRELERKQEEKEALKPFSEMRPIEKAFFGVHGKAWYSEMKKRGLR